MKQIVYLIVIILFIACKTDNAKKVIPKLTEKKVTSININENCLQKSDTLALKEFRVNVANAIKSGDKKRISSYVNFPYRAGVDSLNIDTFLAEGVDVVMQYFDEELIDKKFISSLKTEIQFLNVENSECYEYYIERNFTTLEFAAIFHIGKVNNQIKITRIDFAG